MRKVETNAIRKWIGTIGAMGFGALLYALVSYAEPMAWGDIKKGPPPMHRTGAERSVVQLKEISATLKRIEQRMERWERVATK